jgi:CheY-like chemotaxis protein
MSNLSESRRKRVLIVDGDFRTAQRLAHLLRDDGFEVEVARDGAAAIARLARGPFPDALITELKLAVADGAAVARFGRAQHPQLTVVFAARDPGLLSSESWGSPPPVVLTKPVDYTRLLELLNTESSANQDNLTPAPAGAARH